MFKASSVFADHSKAVILLWIIFCYLCFMFIFVTLIYICETKERALDQQTARDKENMKLSRSL